MRKIVFILLFTVIAGIVSAQTTVNLALPDNCNTDIEKIENLNSQITIFPNPNSGNFTFTSSLDEIIGKASINIYETTGKSIFYETIYCNSNKLVKQINLNDLPSGIYIIELKNSKNIYSTKLLIQK